MGSLGRNRGVTVESRRDGTVRGGQGSRGGVGGVRVVGVRR